MSPISFANFLEEKNSGFRLENRRKYLKLL